jgi:hypothetical protein
MITELFITTLCLRMAVAFRCGDLVPLIDIYQPLFRGFPGLVDQALQIVAVERRCGQTFGG